MPAMPIQESGGVDLDSLAAFADALARADDADAAFRLLTDFGETFGFVGLFARREREAGPADVFQSLTVPVAELFESADFRRAWPVEPAALASSLPVAWSVTEWPGERHMAARIAMSHAARAGVEAGVTLAVRGPWDRTMLLTALCRPYRLALFKPVDMDLWAAAGARFMARLAALAPDPSRPLGLSRRELEILRLAARGLTGGAAAESLGVTEATIKFHLSGARRKLGVRNTAEAVARLLAARLHEGDGSS
jgi:DNA-binding CsgD family transcriptional regulator